MSGLLQSIVALPVPFNMVVLVVLIGCVAGVITSLAKEIRKFFCHRNEMELKREMLERGLDATEIDQVMRATSPPSKPH
jgi:TRAP-type C4-dicarboxylate transport system permease small subunit